LANNRPDQDLEPAGLPVPRLTKIVNRLPFTLTMLVLMAVVGIFTNTHVQQISEHWIDRLGFAPHDLLFLRWERMVTSALVTSGGRVFWEALAMVALSVGLVEWRYGSRRSALTFWGIHLIVLVVNSLLLIFFRKISGNVLSIAVTSARDVGPSAGYFACLGLAVTSLKPPRNWLIGVAIWIGLLIYLSVPAAPDQDAALVLIANQAHAIAFSLGFISAFVGEVPRRLISHPRSKGVGE
jgi:hypothetical protein